MNYPAPFAPAAYAPQYAPSYAPQYGGAIAPYASQAITGAAAADPNAAKPGITSKAWWQETTFNIPRWALGTGAVALAAIGYGWHTGWFDGGRKVTTKRTTHVSARRDPGPRHHGHGRKKAHHTRGRHHGAARHHGGHRFDFDF